MDCSTAILTCMPSRMISKPVPAPNEPCPCKAIDRREDGSPDEENTCKPLTLP